MKKTFKIGSRAFTIVELMVVIAIMALLTAIIMTSVFSSKAKSRDARRVSDVNQIQLSLEQYFDRCGQYPLTLTLAANNGCPSGITLASYTTVIPVPPSGATTYDYAINSTTYPTDYVLHTALEASNAAQQNSLSPFPSGSWTYPTGGSGFTCYDSSAHPLDYCTGPK